MRGWLERWASFALGWLHWFLIDRKSISRLLKALPRLCTPMDCAARPLHHGYGTMPDQIGDVPPSTGTVGKEKSPVSTINHPDLWRHWCVSPVYSESFFFFPRLATTTYELFCPTGPIISHPVYPFVMPTPHSRWIYFWQFYLWRPISKVDAFFCWLYCLQRRLRSPNV